VTSGLTTRPTETKNQPQKNPWLVAFAQTNVLAVEMQAKRRGCYVLNKNATDMGASVAFAKLNQET
jgi:hypothetical protein